MKAVVLSRPCNAKDMVYTDIPIPGVKPGWILVRVHAFGLNHSEAILRCFEIEQDYIHKPIVPGIECVGEVADPSDTDLSKGQTVIALMGGMGRSFNGSYAEYALLPRKNVFVVERGSLSWIELAAVPETYYTAYGSLFECLQITKDDNLLVRGATSTIGQAALQLAHAIGAMTIAACRRESSFEKMKSIGADHCLIDDEHISEQTLEVRPNKILELIGPKTLRDSLLTVSRPGFVCNTGILGNVFTVQHFDPIKYIPNGVHLSGFFSNYPSQEAINSIFDLIHKNKLSPLFSKVFPFEEISQAHELLEKGGSGGKIIVTTT